MLSKRKRRNVQNRIGYKFKNPVLLSQAFVRKSCSFQNGGFDNEVLEFFGDRVLDFLVVKEFSEQYGCIDRDGSFFSCLRTGDLSKMDVNLVKNTNLADQISRLGFAQFMECTEGMERYIMKNKADLFEAILGAVAVDSGWDIPAMQQAYRAMMYSRGNSDNDTVQSGRKISGEDYIDFFETELWKHNLCKTENKYVHTGNNSECSFAVSLNGKFCKVTATGRSDHEAKCRAYERGYKLVRLVLAKEFDEDASYQDQLKLLHDCGFSGDFDLHYEYYPACSNGDATLWRCLGSLCSSDTEFCAEDSCMDDARELVCRAIICSLIGLDDSPDLEGQEESMNTDAVASAEVHGQGLLQLILSKYMSAA
ncbi:MAG: hypothetical protein K6G18_04690 [Treponema sp.]|nr:hypothetical protein [Treponema sp.]